MNWGKAESVKSRKSFPFTESFESKPRLTDKLIWQACSRDDGPVGAQDLEK